MDIIEGVPDENEKASAISKQKAKNPLRLRVLRKLMQNPTETILSSLIRRDDSTLMKSS
jgi:hypothetical protein